jgi:hypothetical protein
MNKAERLRYLTDHYDEPIARVNAINAPLNFIFITDQHNMFRHSTVEAAESLQYIIDRCPNLQCVVSGGDIGNDYDPDPKSFRKSMQDMMDALYALSVPAHCCIGNHDDYIGNCIDNGWDTRNGILPAEMHALCMKNNPTPENYYYVDLDSADGEGYRFAFLNTSDKPFLADENGQYPLAGWRLEISNRQAEWFENEVLHTDRKILVFAHSPIRNVGMFGSEGMPDAIKPYDDLLNGGRLYYHMKNCRNVVAMIAGHVHYDNLYYDDDLPFVTTLPAYRARWTPTCPKREIGTYIETAFDVMSIKDGVIYITRFGAGSDRTVELLRTRDNIRTRKY